MRFPNAKKGIRNIFRSEIIMLFFDLATAIVSIIVMVAGADQLMVGSPGAFWASAALAITHIMRSVKIFFIAV